MTDFFTYFFSLLATYTIVSPVKYRVEIYVNNSLYCYIDPEKNHSVNYMVVDNSKCFGIDLENVHVVADNIQQYDSAKCLVVDIYVEED